VESELLSRGIAPNQIESIMRAFGVASPCHTHPGSLPFVLRKRLSLAATFSTSRGWYILDEPTVGQDSDSLATLAARIRALTVSGCGVIVISHSKRFTRMLDAHQIDLKGGVCDGG
jgi:ABC-type multidrug transport system ATPase subunit